MSEPYLVDGGTQAEGTELIAEEDPAEASGEDQREERGTEEIKVEDQPEEFSAEASVTVQCNRVCAYLKSKHGGGERDGIREKEREENG